jgi:hypothetical protein
MIMRLGIIGPGLIWPKKHISYAYDEMWNALNVCITKDQPPLYALSRAWSDLSVLLAIDELIKTGENIDLKG